MQPPQPTPDESRLSSEMLATADALDHLRAALSQLVHDRPEALRWPEVPTVLVQGREVGQALEAIAGRLSPQP